MLEVSEAMARYLYNRGEVIYKLYEDGTEAEVDDLSEINEHLEYGGIFGVEGNEYS